MDGSVSRSKMAPQRSWLGHLLPIFTASGVAAPTPDWESMGRRWWSHVQFLADDRLEGRDTGSRGYDEAAVYMAEQFRRVGLHPAGVDGFRQTMDFDVVRIDESHCSFDLVRDGKVEPVKLGDDAVIGIGIHAAEQVDAEAVFVGYGLVIPELKWDDLAGQDLKGKIAVFVSGGPADMPSAVKAHYQSLDERRRSLGKAGVIGGIVLENPKSVEIPWARRAGFRFMPRMELRDPGYDAPPPLAFTAAFNLDRVEMLFASSGHTFQEVLTDLRAEKPLPHFPLRVNVRAQVAMTRSEVKSENVVGVLPGSDPSLKGEYVALSAHLDHVGIGEPVKGDRIYSGAMDNASGAASLIEVARSIQESGARPKRSILFVAVTGEEKGLLGSQYFATHPTVSGPIIADLNMDMYNPIFPLKYLEVQGLDESTLGDDIRALAEPAQVQVQPDQEPDHVLFIRSDQYSFIKQGIPALAFKFSFAPGTPEEKLYRAWLAERYHAPLDDLEQPVDFGGAARFNALLTQLTLRVANAGPRPSWKPNSFFRRFAR